MSGSTQRGATTRAERRSTPRTIASAARCTGIGRRVPGGQDLAQGGERPAGRRSAHQRVDEAEVGDAGGRAVRAQLGAQRPAELLDRRLAHGVGRGERAGHERVQRADEQHVAAARGDVGQRSRTVCQVPWTCTAEDALEGGAVGGQDGGRPARRRRWQGRRRSGRRARAARRDGAVDGVARSVTSAAAWAAFSAAAWRSSSARRGRGARGRGREGPRGRPSAAARRL